MNVPKLLPENSAATISVSYSWTNIKQIGRDVRKVNMTATYRLQNTNNRHNIMTKMERSESDLDSDGGYRVYRAFVR